MARTHKGPDDPSNRLTGSASHHSPPEAGTGTGEGAAPERPETDEGGAFADAALRDADAAIQESEAALADAASQEADEAMTGDATNDATTSQGVAYEAIAEADAALRDADAALAAEAERAIGRAAVAPRSLADPLSVQEPQIQPLLPAPEPPPIESYEELLGGLGERPFDSPRPVTPEAAWGRSLRQFARAAVWTLPAAAICYALSGMWGWPTRNSEPAGESPGTWLVVTVFGLILGVAGVLAVTALLSATPGRRWSVGALVLIPAGSLLLAPVLGVIAVARPSVSRTADRIGADAALDLENRFFDNAITRWLGVGGLILLAAGWFLLGCAVLASGVLNRVDGYLLLCAVAIAVLAAYMSWQFLITVAAMVVLAAGLGLAWTASRLTPDGRTPVEG